MRNRDRLRALIGGVVVLAAVAAVVPALVVHGAERATPTTMAANEVPGDIEWVLYTACNKNQQLRMAQTSVVDGRLHVDALNDDGSADDTPAVVAAELQINECLKHYRVNERVGIVFGTPSDTRATRLLLYDYGQRWVLPCLRGHGITPPDGVGLAQFLDPQNWAWGGYYAAAFDQPFDQVLAARHDCGSGYEMLPASQPPLS